MEGKHYCSITLENNLITEMAIVEEDSIGQG